MLFSLSLKLRYYYRRQSKEGKREHREKGWEWLQSGHGTVSAVMVSQQWWLTAVCLRWTRPMTVDIKPYWALPFLINTDCFLLLFWMRKSLSPVIYILRSLPASKKNRDSSKSIGTHRILVKFSGSQKDLLNGTPFA